jgi:sugar O-acyltransferase (sialic acid O-acetyltransferase NeuD family)
MKDVTKDLILIGGGGFALEIYSYVLDDGDHKIVGVLDDKKDCELINKHPELPYLGTLEDYTVKENDRGLICVGNSVSRKELYERSIKAKIRLDNFIHSSAHVSKNANIGQGVFIGPHCIVSAHSNISDNVALNVFCGVGHGACIEYHSVMSPYCVINSDCYLEESLFLGTRVTLNPKMRIGKFSLIDAGSIIRQNIESFSLVSQRPDQKIFLNRILKKKILG